MDDMKTEPIIIKTSYQEVFRQLEAAIMSGELQMNEPIPTEAELCELFKVKRSSVREGTRLLEQSGLVTRNSSRRLVVSPPNKSLSSENIIRSITLNNVTLQEIWQVQRELDAMAARLACENISNSMLNHLKENVADTVKYRKDMDQVVKLDMEFHNLVAHAANNRALTMARDPLGLLLYASSDFVISQLEQSTDRLISAHQHIVDAIADKDPVRANLWMIRHMDDFKRGCLLAGVNLDDSISDFVDRDRLMKVMSSLGINSRFDSQNND